LSESQPSERPQTNICAVLLTVFTVNVLSATASLSGLTIAHGITTIAEGNSAASPGGGIHNEGTLTISNCAFSQNTASNNGGGIFNGGTLTAALSEKT
jgi:predicted outer membrane repeat protein